MTEYKRYDSIAELLDKGSDEELVEVSGAVKATNSVCDTIIALLQEEESYLLVSACSREGWDEEEFMNASVLLNMVYDMISTGAKATVIVGGQYYKRRGIEADAISPGKGVSIRYVPLHPYDEYEDVYPPLPEDDVH